MNYTYPYFRRSLSRNKITKDDIEKYISTIEETNGESESESEESEME